MQGPSFDIGDGEQPIELESSPEILFEAQHPLGESGETPEESVPFATDEPVLERESVEPDLKLEMPADAKTTPPAAASDDASGPSGSEAKVLTDDMDTDLEGLGMVLGKNGKE